MERGGVQPAGGSSVSVVLVGHYYVRRLRDYMATSQEHANLGLRDVEVHCVGVGGRHSDQATGTSTTSFVLCLSTVPSLFMCT